MTPYELFESVPPEIHQYAMKIEQWMIEHGHHEWQLRGICSRNYAEKLEKIRQELESKDFFY